MNSKFRALPQFLKDRVHPDWAERLFSGESHSDEAISFEDYSTSSFFYDRKGSGRTISVSDGKGSELKLFGGRK